MATPLENAAYASTLFKPALGAYTSYNDQQANANHQRVSLLARIAETLNEQRFRQQQQESQQQFVGQQATQAQGASVNLERLRAENSQALADKTADRQAMLSDKSTDRQFALADKSFDRQMKVSEQAQTARDIAELHKQFALAYPEYRKAANVADIEPRPMSDFAQSWEGLGELKADFGDAITAADAKKNTLAATVYLGSARMAYHNLSVAMAATDEAGKLSETEQAAIKNAGLTAIQGAKDMGSIKGVDDAQFASGLAALAGGETEVAKKTFGKQFPAIKALYDQGQERARLMVVNSPEHRAEVTNRIRQEGVAMEGVNRAITGLAAGAAKNPEIGAQYGQFQQDVTDLQQRRAATPVQSDADRNQLIFNAVGAGSGAQQPPPVPAPRPTSASPYQYPGLSILGGLERMNGGMPTAGQFGAAPANILAAPGRAVDTAGRLLSGGLQGIMTGNYTPPQTGLVEMAGRGIGSLLPTGPGDDEQVQQIRNEIQRLTPSAGQADANRQLQYLRRLLESYSRPTDTLLAPAY